MNNKIPKHAVCVYKGILHDIYHWEQRLESGGATTYEAVLHHPSVAVIAITMDNRIIVIHETQAFNGSYTTLPGGIAETDDYASEALRELREETGYVSTSIELFDVIESVVDYSKLEWKSYIYIARGCKYDETATLDPSEHITVQKCTFDDFTGYVLTPDFGIGYLRERLQAELADGRTLADVLSRSR